MKRVIIYLSVLLVVFTVSCYRVKEYEYLNIGFDGNNLNSIFLGQYIDSVRNKETNIPDSISRIFFSDDKIGENERIIYFKDDPKEWYLISLDATPCWIEAVYNGQLSDRMINKRSFLGEAELKRIENRLREEILKPAEKSGKLNHLPDSLLYNTKYK